jgi:regulator of cell morphogenesis and NO signaling
MTTIQPVAIFTPEITVGTIVATHPNLARLFEHLGIDYCCGGKQLLGEACADHRLDVATTISLLESAARALDAVPSEVNAAGMTLTQIADHIEQTHHVYVKTELPRLIEMADRVASKHGERDPRLLELAAIVRTLREEIALFPLIRRIESQTVASCANEIISASIRAMETEHDDAGRAMARIRELTDYFTPDDEACNTHRTLLAGLAAFEADLHRHVHKENNVLFPRALAFKS